MGGSNTLGSLVFYGQDIERLNPVFGDGSFENSGWCYAINPMKEQWVVEAVRLTYSQDAGTLSLTFDCDRRNARGVSFKSKLV